MSRQELASILARAGVLPTGAVPSQLGAPDDDGSPLSLKVGLSPERMAEALSEQLGIPYARPSLLHPPSDLASVIPQDVARRLRVLPVLLSSAGALYLAMEDPTDGAALAECRDIARRPVRVMVASGYELRASFHRWYGGPPPKPLPLPVTPPKRTISVVELDAADLEETPDAPPMEGLATIPADAPTDRLPPLDFPPDPALPVDLHDATPPVPAVAEVPAEPSLLVVQGPAKLVEACRLAVRAHPADVHEADLFAASRVAKALRPFAIVVPQDVFDFDPEAFFELSLAVGAVLVTAVHPRDPHLEPLLRTAVARAARR